MTTKFKATLSLLPLISAVGIIACSADEKEPAAAPATKADPAPLVEMDTSMGKIRLQLDRKAAPGTVDNFLKYVASKHYDDTIFHRVIDGFMIQGGGFKKGTPPTEKKTLPPIKNEAKSSGLKNEAYTIAMARTSAPHSATSQFFINVADNRRGLDPGGASPDGYAVFGKVIDGRDVVDKIAEVKTGSAQLKADYGLTNARDVPVEPVVIKSVRVIAAEGAGDQPAPGAEPGSGE